MEFLHADEIFVCFVSDVPGELLICGRRALIFNIRFKAQNIEPLLLLLIGLSDDAFGSDIGYLHIV